MTTDNKVLIVSYNAIVTHQTAAAVECIVAEEENGDYCIIKSRRSENPPKTVKFKKEDLAALVLHLINPKNPIPKPKPREPDLIVTITGAAGTGKSTLMNLIARAVMEHSGNVVILDDSGLVPQKPSMNVFAGKVVEIQTTQAKKPLSVAQALRDSEMKFAPVFDGTTLSRWSR